MTEAESTGMTPEQNNDTTQKKSRRWKKRLLWWCAGLLGLGVLLCAGLYVYLDIYEDTRPEKVMDALLSETPGSVWNELALRGLTEALSPFDDGSELSARFGETYLQSGEYSYRKDIADEQARTVIFRIRSGGTDLCTVMLREKPGTRRLFGLHDWEVGSMEPLPRPVGLSFVTVSVDAMPGEAVSINGIPLTEDYITDPNVPIGDLSPFEQRLDPLPHMVRYEVPAMYGSVAVTDSAGREIAPAENTGSAVRYTMSGDKHDLVITAPEDVSVSVGGVALTGEDITRTAEPLWAGLEDYVGKPLPPTVTYTLSGLYTVPEVTAVGANGEALIPLVNEKGEFRFFRGEDAALKEQMEGTVRTFFDAYINYSSRAFDELRQVVLLCTILPGTELYSYVQDSRDAMIWASATEVSYDELSFEDFCSLGENCFTCTIRYKADFTAQSWYKNYTYDLQNAYEMVFVRSGGQWYAAAMSAV